MSPEERAQRAWEKCPFGGYYNDLIKAIAAAIREAVAAEREACARLAEKTAAESIATESIATDIRAREKL